MQDCSCKMHRRITSWSQANLENSNKLTSGCSAQWLGKRTDILVLMLLRCLEHVLSVFSHIASSFIWLEWNLVQLDKLYKLYKLFFFFEWHYSLYFSLTFLHPTHHFSSLKYFRDVDSKTENTISQTEVFYLSVFKVVDNEIFFLSYYF